MFSAPAGVGDNSSGQVSRVVSKVGNAGIAAFQPLAEDTQFSGEKLEAEGTRHQALNGSS